MIHHRNITSLLLMFLLMKSVLSISHTPQYKGRKLFGGYRIAPKVCRPTNPAFVKSNAPAICMFNYECSRRKGEVVGACMDGFLFGACCQLSVQQFTENFEKISIFEGPVINVQEIDHVPDVPILLNPDGTPIGSISIDSTTNSDSLFLKSSTINTKDSYENAEKPQIVDISHLEDDFSTLLGHNQVLNDLQLPSLITHSDSNNDIQEQHNTLAINPVTTILRPDQIFQVADPVDQLPALFSHGLHRKNDTGADTILLNKNGTTLNESHNPDEHFKPFSPQSVIVTTTPLKFDTEATNLQAQSTTKSIDTTERITSTKKDSTTFKLTTPFKDIEEKSSSASQVISAYNEKISFPPAKTVTLPMSLYKKSTYAADTKSSSFETTTPMILTTRSEDNLVRVPTIAYDGQSDNKKQDTFDKEEIAINHIISILNDTNDGKLTTQMTNGPTTYKWINTDGLSKPTVVKIITAHPSSSTMNYLPQSSFITASSPNYYHYNSVVTDPSRLTNNYYPSSDSMNSYSTQAANYQDSSYSYSSRPTTNPPAPTVIVLGPLGTEYTTIPTSSTPTHFSENNQKLTSSSNTKLPTNTAKPTLITKKPNIATTLTHNISTVISGNKQVVSVSYISVNLNDKATSKPSITKDPLADVENESHTKLVTKKPSTVYTTLTSWSDKPSFHLKPSTINFHWPNNNHYDKTTDKMPKPEVSTSGSNCEEETTSSDDTNNFPPVRHPELDSTVTHYQDKPTLVEPGEIISEDEIPTPGFVEDIELNNKVDVFVNKIVESLQGNFQNLKDVVYNPMNVTIVTADNVGTKKPISVATTKRPTTKPTIKGTKKPIATRITTTQRISTIKFKPTTVSTRKPSTTKRTKPLKKVTTSTLSSGSSPFDIQTTTPSKPTEASTGIPEITPNANFRSICGIRPLIKMGRIVGGKGATFGEWPWQVLVREATWLGLFTKNKCGGVLITDKYIITAAHCQPGFLASLVAVFGEFDISGELESRRSVTRNIRRVIVNRAYDPATFENDLALLELETPVQFDAHIVPICMPDDNTDYVNRMATVTGWGRLKYNGGVPSVLQEVKVPIMENSVCQEMFQTAGHSKLIIDSFMCAGYANGQKDSCEGDSGGPLTLQRSDGRWILVGTVSHGIKCAAPYLPGVYMRTTYFKPWLHSITGV
ncbi:PREDICTED: uncharacterized protein LOC105368979 [Ceratosolen solmsi marchali]|uniref:Uncharacterized protein LOC105368979 n=1 Tax=Ceratosolen solmsi marchali TaxID=326594 RepID=A0AAJ6YY58_9HYME|nr:PREDICTED: uncharacterized protein LOC105368979 [Ceratosolen solmsi marchali]